MSLDDRQLQHIQGCTDDGVIPPSEAYTNLAWIMDVLSGSLVYTS